MEMGTGTLLGSCSVPGSQSRSLVGSAGSWGRRVARAGCGLEFWDVEPSQGFPSHTRGIRLTSPSSSAAAARGTPQILSTTGEKCRIWNIPAGFYLRLQQDGEGSIPWGVTRLGSL